MGDRSPFSSLPTDPVPTFIFSFYVGEEDWQSTYKTEGHGRLGRSSYTGTEWASKQGSRLPDGILRGCGSTRRGGGPTPSPVCPRLPPARLPWGLGAAGPPRARHTDGAGSEQREGEITPRVLPTQLALDGDQQCSPMSSRGRYFHAPSWGSSARVHSQQARHHRQGEGHTFVSIKHRYV